MPQIALPVEFFRKERNTGYSNWKTAFWRELVSNSLDAGATRIAVVETADGWLEFEDNGSGMSRSVCENVYLSIGRSTKDSNDGTVGGFGRARILTCFSMEDYIIEGDGYRVTGKGADYTISDGPEREAGLMVKIKPDLYANWRTNLLTVLNQCWLPSLEITYNGERLFPDWLVAKDNHYLELSGQIGLANGGFASLGRAGFVIDSALSNTGVSANKIYFRVNGMAMFEAFASLKGTSLIVEIAPGVARDVLTANRDGIKHAGWDVVNKLTEEVQNEGKIALRKTARRDRILCGDLRNLKLMNPAAAANLDVRLPRSSSFADTPIEAFAEGGSGFAILPRGYFPDEPMYFSVLTENLSHMAIADMWRPGYETPAMQRLFRAWVDACLIGLEAFIRVKPHKNFLWLPGLTFRSGVEAEAHCFNTYFGQVYALSVNPLRTNRGMLGLLDGESDESKVFDLRYNLSNAAHRQQLFAAALHEVAHIEEMAHDVDYASALTDLLCEVDMPKFLRQSKGW